MTVENEMNSDDFADWRAIPATLLFIASFFLPIAGSETTISPIEVLLVMFTMPWTFIPACIVVAINVSLAFGLIGCLRTDFDQASRNTITSLWLLAVAATVFVCNPVFLLPFFILWEFGFRIYPGPALLCWIASLTLLLFCAGGSRQQKSWNRCQV